MHGTAANAASQRTGDTAGLHIDALRQMHLQFAARRDEDVAAIMREAADLTPEQRSAVEHFQQRLAEVEANIAELEETRADCIRVIGRDLEQARQETDAGTSSAFNYLQVRLAHDAMLTQIETMHREASDGLVKLHGQLTRAHHLSVKAFAPKYLAERQQRADKQFRKFLRGYNGRALGTTAARAPRAREAHRQTSTISSSTTRTTRTTVTALAGADPSGSRPSIGARGERPPAPSEDDPQPPNRIRLAHSWVLPGISTAPAGSIVAFKEVAA